MQRFDRILGILLFLRSQQAVSATRLAKHFHVSTRTIYRDIEALSSLGVPVYAERGREGGFQLLKGYFLPPLMFSRDEAISLLLGITLMRSLRTRPFPEALMQAEQKILAALPEHLHTILQKAEGFIGFEELPHDIFHPEPILSSNKGLQEKVVDDQESSAISTFLRALLENCGLLLKYHSPYRGQSPDFLIEPEGLFWDREHWYLVGKQLDNGEGQRLWRADRVVQITLQSSITLEARVFDIRKLLGHSWLHAAMEQWRRTAPVKIRLSGEQAERLKQDWYYRHASFEPLTEQRILMTFGESDPKVVLELVRWLGPGAELLEPEEWRELVKKELEAMLEQYTSTHQETPLEI